MLLNIGFNFFVGGVFMSLIFIANRLDNGRQVKGYYWCIEEHHIENMSGKHYIKSIKNGIDYEIDISTVAEFNENIENFEKAKAELKAELSKPFIKFFDWLERVLSK